VLRGIEAVLRCEGRYGVDSSAFPLRELLTATLVGGSLYGLAMGSFGLRPLQCAYSAIKVPLLLLVSTVICLPSFFAVNTVLGLRDEFRAALRGVLAAQATFAVTLLSLAPLTLVAYLTVERYPLPNFINGVQFALATVAAHVTLRRHYDPLVRRERRHKVARFAWLFFYVFVAIQMAWVLRPFIGHPGLPVAFFREDAWTNAYVQILRLIATTLGW
jgi:hypothetical protein